MSDFDAIVIGAGPAGEVCAGELAQGGLKVAVVERELVAGECSYWACIPSKTLLRPGEALAEARQVPGAREAVDEDGVHPQAALAYRNFMVADYDDEGQAKWLDDMGIDLLRGDGRLTGPGTVEVDGTTHRARFVVCATGSSPSFPPVDGLAEAEGVWTNREVTGLTEVPESLIVLGGGPVGTEMAQALCRLGARVTVVEGSDRLLSREAPRLGETMAAALRTEGIELRLGVHATRVAYDGGTYAVDLDDGSEVSAQRLLVATGRRPRGAESGAESAGATLGQSGGIEVDEHMRAADGLWAIGDCTGLPMFTHVGKYQARIAAADILGREARADYRALPRVVFTDPQAAAVGAAEGEREGTVELASVARTATYTSEYAERPGYLTLLADGERLVGAHAVGPEAGEWLGQATLAIRAEVPLAVLRDVIQPFPTFSEAFVSALAAL